MVGATGPRQRRTWPRAQPDRAAFFNGALVRYLDFMDIFMVEGQTFQWSDNFAVTVAAAEYADAGGDDFMAALAVAYQVQARFGEQSPLQEQGLDHVTHLAFSMPAACARALASWRSPSSTATYGPSSSHRSASSAPMSRTCS